MVKSENEGLVEKVWEKRKAVALNSLFIHKRHDTRKMAFTGKYAESEIKYIGKRMKKME